MNAVLAKYPGTTPVAGAGQYSGAIGVNTDGTLYTSGSTGCAQNYKGVGAQLGAIISPDCKTAGVVLGNYFAVQVPLKKYNAFTSADYALSDHVTAYAQFNFSESTALDQTSPGSTKTSVSAPQELIIPISNPYVQANANLLSLINSAYGGVAPPNAKIFESKLMYGWGNRVQIYKYDVWQAVAGLKGDIPGTKLTWDIYASLGRSNYTSRATGDVSISAINNVLANEGVGGCNWNPLGIQPVSSACLKYAGRTDNTTDVLTSKDIEGTLQGPLFALPAGSVKFALGADYRYSDYSYQPDATFVTGDTLSYGTDSSSAGSQNAKELFGELLLPVFRNRRFAQDLSLDLGYRFSKYNGFGGKNTWKADVNWQVASAFRLRGGYSVAIRAPSLSDLYVGQSVSNTALNGGDPCDVNSTYRTGANGPQVRSLCASQSSAAGSPTYTYTGSSVPVQSGGNSLLQPENANTWTIGGVISPLDRLHISVDYYNINISGAISSLSSGQVLSDCYTASATDHFLQLIRFANAFSATRVLEISCCLPREPSILII